MNLKSLTLLTAAALIPATTVFADEDARRAEKERAVAAQKEKEAHRAEEKKREAEDRARNAAAVMERLTDLRAQLKNVEGEGASEDKKEQLRRQIGEAEAKLAALAGKGKSDFPPEFRERAEKLEMAGRRIKHVRMAAENLRAADMPDMAHELAERAEAMERELAHAKEELMAQMKHREEPKKPGRDGEGRPEVNELRAENEKLRAELQEMRRAIEELKAKQ
ncbi:MAG: hypothetical protein U0996_15415 [Planctomycetaceae bacterium]